jgi:hypothetical protein
MIDNYRGWRKAAAVSLALISAASGGRGQSADALINKLLEKGILSSQEAKDLKAETNQDFTSAYQAKTGMPSWVTAYKFGGDFRGRFDGIYGENADQVDRNRLRYRLRIGLTAMLQDDFEVGLKLASGDPVNQFGGNSASANSTFTGNASKKFVWINLAYARWSPLHTPDFSGAFTFGKMENPFVFPSSMLFAKDYAPEGLSAQLAYQLGAHHSLKFNAGAFVLNEVAASSNDPWLGATQLRFDSAWTPEISSSVGLTALAISSTEHLGSTDVPNLNRGNTRDASGVPAYDFNPINVDTSLTYTLQSFPGFMGKLPITLSGEYLNNPAASDQNQACTVGLTFGKAAKKGQWDVGYRWMEIQGNAWYEELLECDFGAYYQVQQPNAGFNTTSNPNGAGFGTGANIRGHIIKANYSPYDSFTLSFTVYLTELINASPAGSKTGSSRVQLDGMWRF